MVPQNAPQKHFLATHPRVWKSAQGVQFALFAYGLAQLVCGAALQGLSIIVPSAPGQGMRMDAGWALRALLICEGALWCFVSLYLYPQVRGARALHWTPAAAAPALGKRMRCG
jgi:hypothetical protein